MSTLNVFKSLCKNDNSTSGTFQIFSPNQFIHQSLFWTAYDNLTLHL